MNDTPTIPHGYRLVSGPHTAAEVGEGWTICADWTGANGHGWRPRPGCIHEAGNLRSMFDGRIKAMCYSDDPERDIYRIEKVTP